MTTLATSPRTVLSPGHRTTDTTPDLPPISQRLTQLESRASQRTLLARPERRVVVPGVGREVEVKVASERSEWEEAYLLVAQNYRNRGYEPSDARGLRFTAFHALPDTTTFVAKH